MSTENPASAEQVAIPVQEPSAPSSDAKPEDAAPESAESQKPEPSEADKLKQAYEKRIARQTAANREQQRQYEDARKKIAELEEKVKATQPRDEKPNPDNYLTQEEYIQAEIKWGIAQEKKAEIENASKPTPEQIAQNAREFERKVITFKAREAEFAKSNPEYEKAATVVNTFVNMLDTSTPAFKAFEDMVFGSEKAPAIIQHLGQNPVEIARLVRLGPIELKYAMEDIIDQISDAPKPVMDGPDEPTPEALPTPPTPLKGAAKTAKHPDKMDGKELLERMEQLRRRR